VPPLPSHVLAIDQGTTGTRVLVVDARGEVTGQAYAEHRQHYPRPGWVEHDPEELWERVVGCCRAAVADAGVDPGDLAGLGITNQRETTILWERASGRPVHNALVWQDLRSADLCRRLEAEGAGELVAERTGLVLDPYFSGTKVAWLLEHVDGLRSRAERGELCFGTVDSWLVWKLTGGAVHVTDPTNASRTLLMDLRTLDYDEELLELLGVPSPLLPEIRPSGAVLGETVTELLGVRLPVAGVLGDQQSALFAQACFSPGQAKNTYGTGSFVLANTGSAPVEARGALLATVALGLAAGAEYALEGSIFATGAAVQWLRDGLGVIHEAAETETLAASLAGNDDVWFVPALAGLGAPYWDPTARGTLLGVTRATTRAHLARAVLEGIAWRTRDVTEAMAAAGRPVEELRADGGAASNAWLMQFQADVLGVPVDVAAHTETTSLGAAYLAGLTTGVWRDRAEVATLRRTGRRFEPSSSPAAAGRDELYARWRQAVARAEGWAG